MNTNGTHSGGSHRGDDGGSGPDRTAELLTEALSQQASTVQTDPGALQAIQQRTSGSAARQPRGRWVLAAGGAGLATAAIVTGVVLVQNAGDDRGGAPATSPSTQTSPDATATTPSPGGMHQGVYDPRPGAGRRQVDVVYLVPATSVGSVRLTVEPHTVASVDAEFRTVAVHEFLTSRPIDPDYRSGWPEGVDISSMTVKGSTMRIALTGDVDLAERGDLSREEARMAVQALLFTAGSGTDALFTYNGRPVTTLLGEDVSKPVTLLPADQVRSFISIDNVVEGQTLAAPVKVTVSGNVYEGNLLWTLFTGAGGTVDAGYVTTAQGEWRQAVISLGDLEPGDYRIECADDSGKGGSVFFEDTKDFTVR